MSLGDLRLTLTGREDFVSGNLTNNLTRATTSNNPEHFTYRLGLLYASAIGASPYVSYATSLQPQTGVERGGSGFVPQTGGPARPWKPPCWARRWTWRCWWTRSAIRG